MNRKEAIIHLQSAQSMLLGADNKPISDLYYALDIAINSLKVDEAYDLMYENPNGWIPVTERLPEEKINPITQDFYEYQCTFKSDDVYDVRSYKFGKGHWWHGCGIVDKYVIAWMPIPEPYKADMRGET